MIPIENSLQGEVGHSMDLLYEREVRVISECYLEIAHCLWAMFKILVKSSAFYGRAQAIDQCRRWLLEHIGHAELTECSSTARSAVSQKRTLTGRPFATSMRPNITDSAFSPKG